ncbi:MAG: group III truncated hemoglobin [Saprospiraceae bacterium]
MVDIITIDDIQLLVNNFYGKIRQDDLLAAIFEQVIQDRWEIHLEKMYRFWQTILLNEHTYYGNPFGPHAPLPLKKIHFDRWKCLFNETVDECFLDLRLMKQNGELQKWLRCSFLKFYTKIKPI